MNELLLDLEGVDLSSLECDVDRIEELNPQRGSMRQLDGVPFVSADRTEAVAFKDVREDEFWVPYHVPGNPILPAVLMIEAAAQLASVLVKLKHDDAGFVGFVGANDFKFRRPVRPGDRLYLLGREVRWGTRLSLCHTQGVVGGRVVFEGSVSGTPMPVRGQAT